jgi:hypothetical protein
MFESVVVKALEQVDDQSAKLKKKDLKPLSVIVLAGGGATSKYVFSRLQEYCKTRLGETVMVRRDSRAWSAVTRGAAIRGLESGVVVSRESKRAYGFVCHQKFDDELHDEEESFHCPIYGKRVCDRMDWILEKVR